MNAPAFRPAASATTTAFLLLLFLHLPAALLAQPCGLSCKFRLCQASGELGQRGRVVLQRGPFVAPQGPVICHPREEIAYVLEVGEALVSVHGRSRRPISQYMPGPLGAPFARAFFGVRRVPALGRSAVVKAKSRGNQQRVLDGLCILLPVVRYARLFKKGKVRSVVRTKGSGRDCVAFRVSVPLLLVELSWVGGDDLDLAVITPRGDLLSRFNQRDRKGGRFLSDASEKCAEKMAVGKEIVRYRLQGQVAGGVYLVQLRHFKNCGDGPTAWTLRATVDDKVRLLQKGRANADDSALFRELTFGI